ncbi:hypothetical protein ACFFNY_09610 [Paenibacillus hodogayensis]|uniref:Flagellar protein FliL n=1 Tax=Paenibacillus hodogayensis TaxID=279208 RepID=A0ABV5VUA3_9BACL
MIKNRFWFFVVIVCLFVSIAANWYQYEKNVSDQQKVDHAFASELGRVASALDAKTEDNRVVYLLIVEHLSKASALSSHNSDNKLASSISSHLSEMINAFRNSSQNPNGIRDQDELKKLFVQLSEEPINMEIYSKIFDILYKQ